MRFNICLVRINEFYQLYEDFAVSLCRSLIDLGHACRIRQNICAAEAINILVGSTVFAARVLSLTEELRGKPYIVYQLEMLDGQVGLLPQFPEYWGLLRNAKAVWDFSPSNAEYLKSRGLDAVYHVPAGFHRSLESFRPRQEPDIDVLFFGSPHQRRSIVLDALTERGIEVVKLHGVFGAARNGFIARSKIVLNIHAWDGLATPEALRLSLLLANRAFVISESVDHNPYGDGVVYGAYGDLPDLCEHYLRAPASVREGVAEEGYFAVRKIDFVNILRSTLAAMGPAALEALTAEGGWQAPSYDAQARDEILGIVPPGARRVLDIGCADGVVGASLKARQACHVTGIEMAPEAALQAAKALDLAICGDAFAVLPQLPDESYDCVLLLGVLEHVADAAELLRLAAAKLCRDGALILCVPNVSHWSVVQGLLEGRWVYTDTGVFDRTHRSFFTRNGLRQALGQVGMEIVDVHSIKLERQAPSQPMMELLARRSDAAQTANRHLHVFQFVLTCRRF